MDPDSPRARRAARSTPKRVDMSQVKWGKILGIVALIALVGAFIAFPFFAGSGENEPCPFGHCHTGLHIWVQGDPEVEDDWHRITFQSPRYTLQGETGPGIMPLRIHFHAGESKEQVHWEPQTGARIEMRDFLALTDISLTSDSFTSSGAHEDFPNQAWVKRDVNITAYRAFGEEQDWEEISVSRFLDLQPRWGMKYLVIVGDPSPDLVEQFQRGVPFPSADRGLLNS